MNIFYKILSISIISVICASDIFAYNDSILLSEHNAHRDSTMSVTANITFTKIPTENYGFDYWRGNDYDKDEYPNYLSVYPQKDTALSFNPQKICPPPKRHEALELNFNKL